MAILKDTQINGDLNITGQLEIGAACTVGADGHIGTSNTINCGNLISAGILVKNGEVTKCSIESTGHITTNSLSLTGSNTVINLGSGNLKGSNSNLIIDGSSGNITASTFNAKSDLRLKENFQPLDIKKSILDLSTYKFDFINGAKNQIGCKAQDLQEICPEIVDEGDDGYLSIQESKIVYLLLEEVKKLRREVDELKR